MSIPRNPSLLEASLRWAILGLLIILPLFESPKNLLFGGAFLLWILITLKDTSPTPYPAGTAWIFGGYIAATILASLFASIQSNAWHGTWDTFRFLGMYFLVQRIASQGSMGIVFWGPIFGTTVALGHGLIASAAPQTNLQLRSVGHTNHSAIYLLLSFGMALAVALGGRVMKWRIMASVVACFLFEGILRTSSRGAVGVALILPLIMGASLDGFRTRRFFISVCASMILGGYTFSTKQAAVIETVELYQSHNNLSNRDRLWRVSFEIFRQHPFVGIGPNNFATAANETHLQQWLASQGRSYHPENYYYSSHAHSLYFNTLAERGILGAAALIALLVWLLFWLIRIQPARGANGEAVVVWIAAVAALCITVLIGMINTTLHHEHGMLTLALLGMAINSNTTSVRPPLPAPPCNQA